MEDESAEVAAIYDAIEDISGLLGSAPNSITRHSMSSMGECMTGGVGTTFYRAPEQEKSGSRTKGEGDYNMQADMYSLGVIVFEMLHPPFATYMERSETLQRLRGEVHHSTSGGGQDPAYDSGEKEQSRHHNSQADDNFRALRHERFPSSFIEKTPENAQRIILWCLESHPAKRPTATQLLKVSNLMMMADTTV